MIEIASKKFQVDKIKEAANKIDSNEFITGYEVSLKREGLVKDVTPPIRSITVNAEKEISLEMLAWYQFRAQLSQR